MSKSIWWNIAIPYMVLLLALSLTITGCNFLPENKKIDYKSASKLPPLEIPPDLITPEIDERYAIPSLNSPSSTTFSTFNSEQGGQTGTRSSSLLPISGQGVHIERAGTQRWLVVPQAPEEVWPIVKEFWQELGFLIKLETPEAGIIETDWAENRAKIPQGFIRNILSTFLDSIYSTAQRDKFRTRLERSQTGTTEIYISHRGMDEVIEGGITQRTIWQPRSGDPDLEAEMLSRLMIRFGVQEEQVQQVLTTISTTQERAHIDRNQEATTLIVNEAFDRSWRRVGLALDRVGFTVEDRNRLDGIYFVRYVDPDSDNYKSGDDKGILSGLMFWRTDNTDDTKTEKYRIQVMEIGASSSRVSVFNEKDDTPVDSTTAHRILDLLFAQLK